MSNRIEIPEATGEPIDLAALGIKHGFRHDPMAWVENDRSLTGARVRTAVFGQPQDGDRKLIEDYDIAAFATHVMSQVRRSGSILVLALAVASVVHGAGEGAESYDARRQAYLAAYVKRPLRQGPNPRTWVDVERWCVAHACLAEGVRLDEANKYLSEVAYCSLWHGLVADADIQVTDLLRTYIEFKEGDRLSDAAREHLLDMFRKWTVPNPDRNRRADEEYQWPCEYTENHSLNILVAAYLIDQVLGRDRALRRELLQRFLADRARWGWSEFHSPSYAIATAKALTCLSDFAQDKSIADAARMHLDVLIFEFANQCLHNWRGVPFARGYGSQVNNRRNSFFELSRLLFGDPNENAKYAGGTFLAHLLTSRYRPPAAAVSLARDVQERGRYRMTETATSGAAKLRVPIEIWATPYVTVASAQGFGSYYDGCYWSISFASSPANVITGRYGKGRNILQRDNVLVTFGDVKWHGKLTKETKGNVTIGGDGTAFVGQVALADDCHLLMVGDREEFGPKTFAGALAGLGAKLEDGAVSWTMPDGRRIRMENRRVGEFWSLTSAYENDRRLRLDRNMLFDSPYLRSVRGSRAVDVRWGGKGWRYDFRDPASPQVVETAGAPFGTLPAEAVTGALGMQFVYVPPGEFPMGSGAAEGRANERPQRWVALGGFYMSETEATIGQYRQYLAAVPDARRLPDWYEKDHAKSNEHPVAWVSWGEAKAFCDWLTEKDGAVYRLPTEAEWEKAARGYSHRAYPWGADYDGTQAGTKTNNYSPVGRFPADVSPFGVMDMAGNVWEWCADWYAPGYYTAAPARDPAGPDVGTQRSLRGCGWNFDPDTFRCSYRSGLAPAQRSLHIGFRIVRESPE